MVGFKKFNNNPNNIKNGDCVVRAISNATERTWEEVYISLCNLGFKLKVMPNCKKAYSVYLKDYSFITPKIVKGSKRPKVKDFTKGTYVLSCANHLTMVRDGNLYDSWDCREKAVYCYWEINKGDNK